MSDEAQKAPADGEPTKMGRPSKFSERLAETILAMAAEGISDAKIAAKLGIAASTLALWKAKRPDFSEAFVDARRTAAEIIEAAMFQRATGYRHPAVKFISTKFGVETLKYTEVYPPDPAAAQLLLRNWFPGEWRDTQRLEHTGKDGGPIETTGPQIIITLPSNGREAPKEEAPPPPPQWVLRNKESGGYVGDVGGAGTYAFFPAEDARLIAFASEQEAMDFARDANLWKLLEAVPKDQA